MLATAPALAQPFALVGGRVVLHDRSLLEATVLIEEGVVTEIGGRVPERAREVRVGGRLVLPGIVDLHGDAFERALCPRPGVQLPLAMALRENDAALLAGGITTSFLSATDSIEPGLRSRAMLRALVAALGQPDPARGCDLRLHVRHETTHIEGHDELVRWMETGRVGLLSLADHLPVGDDAVTFGRYVAGVRRRLDLPESEVGALIGRGIAARAEGHELDVQLAALAARLGIPLASHDDDSEAAIDASLALGIAISEFPISVPIARRARAGGAAVLMGAPNYVRGGSHVGWMSVAEALSAGVVDCLCSDYHYPSLFHAPFLAARTGVLDLPRAWSLVSDAPARAAALDGRKGRIAVGHDADLVVVDGAGDLPRLEAVWVGGCEVARFG